MTRLPDNLLMLHRRHTSHPARLQSLFRAWVAATILLCAGRSFAQLSTVTSSNPKDGLRVKTEWPSSIAPSGGYVPFFVELTSTRGPRELRLVVHRQSGPGGVEVNQSVLVQANQPTRVTLLVPVTMRGFWGELRIYEGVTELDKLRQTGFSGGFAFGRGEMPSMLLLSRSVPDWRVLDQTVISSFAAQSSTTPHISLPPDRAPTRWMEYSALDLVLTSLTDLDQMPREGRDALVAWTLAGGNLVVWGVGTEQDRDKLDRVLELNNRLPVGASWRRPKPEERRIITAATPSLSNMAWPQEAMRRLESQGVEAYRAYCVELLQRFGGTADSAQEQNNLAWTCVLGPDAVSDMNRVVQLAQRAVASTGRNAAYLNTLGVALYRAGRFDEAIDKLNQSMAAGGQGGIPEDWFFLAMAYSKLDNESKAKEWLDRATQAMGTGQSKQEWQSFRREAEAILGGKDVNEVLRGQANAQKRDTPQTPAADISDAFVIRSFGFGQLARMTATDPFPGTEVEWAWLFNSLDIDRVRWSGRHGMAGTGENWDFWNFLIAGVGRAPVGAFQVLITAFALIIGPANYFFFRQRRRLYLLILTVPALALATSGILFGYSLASDGFAVRTRVRSVTMLDQLRGEGVNLSRISYYAGMAPTGGLRFTADTAVFPLRPDSNNADYRVMEWTDQQHLSTGWLRSRTPTQFMTVGVRPVGEQLTIGPDAAGVIRVTNNLGAVIKLLVVSDADGALHVAENISKGARVSTKPQSIADAHAAVRTLIEGQKLEAPKEIVDRSSWTLFSWSGVWSNSVTPSWGSGLLEQNLRRFSGTTPQQPYLESRTYIAVTERPSYVELGVAETSDEDCLYVTLGSY